MKLIARLRRYLKAKAYEREQRWCERQNIRVRQRWAEEDAMWREMENDPRLSNNNLSNIHAKREQ